MELFQIDPNKSIAELSLGNKKKVGLASDSPDLEHVDFR